MLPGNAAGLPVEFLVAAVETEGCIACAQAAFPQPTLRHHCYLPFTMEI